MGQMYRTWDKMAPAHQAAMLHDAAKILDRLDRSEVV
jgi:hypothetical protein